MVKVRGTDVLRSVDSVNGLADDAHEQKKDEVHRESRFRQAVIGSSASCCMEVYVAANAATFFTFASKPPARSE